jgi:hypothetical protein
MFGRNVEISEIKGKFTAIGFYPVVPRGDPFASYLHQQYSEYGDVIEDRAYRG